jgi:hypothetical protein
MTVEAKDSCGIKGIRIVDWSKDGRFLLAELVTWVYESDALIVPAPIVYDVSKNEFFRPDVYRVFDECYKTDAFKEKPEPTGTHCEFELHAEGFLHDGSIIVSASRPPDDPSYEQAFCLDHKQTFEFDLGSNRIKQLPGSIRRSTLAFRSLRRPHNPNLTPSDWVGRLSTRLCPVFSDPHILSRKFLSYFRRFRRLLDNRGVLDASRV